MADEKLAGLTVFRFEDGSTLFEFDGGMYVHIMRVDQSQPTSLTLDTVAMMMVEYAVWEDKVLQDDEQEGMRMLEEAMREHACVSVP